MNRDVVAALHVRSGLVMTEVVQPEDTEESRYAGTLRVSMLGGFRVAFGEHEIPETGWRLGKAKSLVKLLALAPDRRLHREQVIDYLWYDLGIEAGANNFHQALHVARRTLATLLPGAAPTEILRLRQQILSFDPPCSVQTDVEAFEQAAMVALQPQRNLDALYQAIDIYSGALLPDDRYEEWTLERRDLLREQYVTLLLGAASIHEGRREATPAIDVLRRVVALEPLHEEAHAALMRIYALSDRRHLAIRQYDRLRDALEREIGAEPEAIVTELYQAISLGLFPAETWQPETMPAVRPAAPYELSESIQAFLQRKPDFVGRERELQALEATLSRVIRSEGNAVLVAGEPGIGKTRLIEEFARFCRAQHILVYWARGYEGPGAPPYWPWVQMVREYLSDHDADTINREIGAGVADIGRVVPELLAMLPVDGGRVALDADQERFRLFDSLTAFFKRVARRGPLVLVLDDLQWFDRSSLLMLEFLAGEMQASRLMVVGTYRPVEVDRHHPLIRTLAELSRAGMSDRIYLNGLSPEHVARYSEIAIGHAPPDGLADAIHFQTGGNPFFVREVVQLLADEDRFHNARDVRSWKLTIPHGIRETIDLRAGQLSQDACQTLTSAAVVGQEFDQEIVRAVTGQPVSSVLDALDESLSLGLVGEVAGSPGRFRFNHAIAREAIVDTLSSTRRMSLHLRTAEAIEGLPAPVRDERVADLAHHYAAAASLGVADRAIRYLRLAAQQASTRIAYSEAADYLQRAVDIHATASGQADVTCCELHLELGEALTGAGDSTEAQAAFEEAVSIARDLDNPRLLARAVTGVFEAGYYSAYSYTQFVPLLEEGLRALSDEDADLRVRLLSRLATSLQENAADRRRMICVSNEATRLAVETHLVDDLPFALYARFLAQWSPHTSDTALADATELIVAAGDAGDVRMLLVGHAWRTFLLVEDGDFDQVDGAIEAYGDVVRASRQRHYEWSYRLRLAMRKLMAGPLDEAEQAMGDALAIGLRTWPGPARANHFQQLFYVRRLQGRSNELVDQARDLIEIYPDNPLWSCMLANLLLDTGDTAGATAEIDRVFQSGLERITPDYFWLANVALLGEACARLANQPKRVKTVYATLQPFVGRFVSPGTNAVCLGPVSHYLALLAAAGANPKRAAIYRDAAIQQCERAGQATFLQWMQAAS